jgi:hypothetical protein
MNTNRVRLLWFTVVLFAISALPAFAASVRIVRLSLAQGDVQIDRNSGDGCEQAIANMPVIAGARIYAAENAKAELEFEDGSSVRLAGPAQITLTELSTSKESPVNVIQVDSGMVYVNARLHHHDDFRIVTSSGESFAISRPGHLRFTVDQQTASIAVMDGEAIVQDGGRNAKVHSGETYNYVLGQPDSAARQASVPPQPEDDWDRQRDSNEDQYASAGAQYSGSDDPNAYGVADLGQYGTYSDLPGYGMAWQPNGVGPDWDPFGYGAWSYYPGWGWTFVSGYNWGWAPFYFGNWCYVGGRGWWWRPGPGHGGGRGGFGFGFHPQPRWVGAPGHGWNAPHPPAHAARGTVAIAGSHLSVGPIGATHGIATHGGAAQSGAASGTSAGHSFVGDAASRRSGPPSAGRATLNSSSGNPSIVGRQGSYRLTGSTAGRNGVARPPSGYAMRAGSSFTGRSYANAGTSGTYTPSSMPRGTSPSVSSAPHVSSGSMGGGAPHVSSFSGGGGGGSFHGGGGGGGFHGGGGGGGHR